MLCQFYRLVVNQAGKVGDYLCTGGRKRLTFYGNGPEEFETEEKDGDT